MAIEDVSARLGRTGQPRARACCDGDGCTREEVVASAKGNQGHALKKVQQMGWQVVKGRLLCPACVARRKVVNMQERARKAPAPELRQPTQKQKREIVLLLDEVYDPEAKRYKGGDTDETVADVLDGVMPGWVAEIREEFFGPDGGNHDMQALAGEVEAMLAEIGAARARGEAFLKECEKLQGQLGEVRAALAKIVKAVGPRKAVGVR